MGTYSAYASNDIYRFIEPSSHICASSKRYTCQNHERCLRAEHIRIQRLRGSPVSPQTSLAYLMFSPHRFVYDGSGWVRLFSGFESCFEKSLASGNNSKEARTTWTYRTRSTQVRMMRHRTSFCVVTDVLGCSIYAATY